MMDSYEISEVKGLQQRKRRAERVWNVLTILVVMVLLCAITFFILIFINPNSSFNPFPPPTFNPADATATITVTPRFTLIPSWTPTNGSIQITDTPNLSTVAMVTQSVIENPTSITPTLAGKKDNFAFVLQQGSPNAIASTEFHPEAGCNWSGIAGQATSLNGEPLRGLFVQLGGSMPGVANMDNLIMTGLAPQYGLGGFEFTLAGKPVASNSTLWIQLLDQQNLPLSDRIYFNTYDDCQKNLIIIYFTQVH
jgi:hypothetical protein